MKIIKILNVNAFPNPHAIEAKRLYNRDNAEAIHMALKLGQSLKKSISLL
jgi:hypothetical protein